MGVINVEIKRISDLIELLKEYDPRLFIGISYEEICYGNIDHFELKGDTLYIGE